MTMQIHLKCFATLAEAGACDYKGSTPYTVKEGAQVRDLMKAAKIAEKEVKLIFVNGKQSEFDTVLHAGDQVGLAPAVGGM
jgi:molybdopterin converting factor small subunit